MYRLTPSGAESARIELVKNGLPNGSGPFCIVVGTMIAVGDSLTPLCGALFGLAPIVMCCLAVRRRIARRGANALMMEADIHSDAVTVAASHSSAEGPRLDAGEEGRPFGRGEE